MATPVQATVKVTILNLRPATVARVVWIRDAKGRVPGKILVESATGKILDLGRFERRYEETASAVQAAPTPTVTRHLDRIDEEGE